MQSPVTGNVDRGGGVVPEQNVTTVTAAPLAPVAPRSPLEPAHALNIRHNTINFFISPPIGPRNSEGL